MSLCTASSDIDVALAFIYRQGMFTSGNDSPGSVRSLKLKFQQKNADMEGSLRKYGSKSPR